MSEQLALEMVEIGLDVPQGYKRTEVGVIPEDWEVIKGGQLFSKIQDGTHFSPKVNGGKFLYVTSKNIKFGHLDLRSAEYIDQAQHEAIYKRCDVMKNDILLTKDGANTGNAALNTLDEPFSLLSSVAFLRLNENKHSSEFFLQQILSRDFQVYIQEEMSGNAITRLTLSKINNLNFFVPPLKEQTAIATALSDVDALINELEQLIAKKQAIKTATIQQLLTGRTRLPQFALRDDGTPKGYKASELGEIPEDWDICLLQDAVDFLDGLRRPVKSSERLKIQGTYPYYGASGIVDYVNDYLFDDELILLGEDGENILSRNLPLAFQVSGKIWVNNHAHVMKPKAFFNITYLTSYLESLDYSLLNSGTAQPKLNKQSCLKIKINNPSFQEQTAIASILTDMDSDISSLQQRLSKTRQIKQGMMQELLTGKTRLKT